MKNISSYQNALDFIFSFVNNSQSHAVNFAPENYDLARMEVFMARMGDPQKAYPCIHVAGTKGKGSVSALCASALKAAGYRVGLNTSPHLQEFTERIQVNNSPITPDELVLLVQEVQPHIEAISGLTTFEIITALAMLHFARSKIDIAVFEVGLGGRLDATNIVTPLVSIITSISLDHTQILGNSLKKIATEKGGIIKPNIPVVISSQKEEARQTIARIALEKNAPLIEIGTTCKYISASHSLQKQTVWIWGLGEDDKMQDFLEDRQGQSWQPTEVQIPLLGTHQAENATVAYAALQIVNETGFTVEFDKIRTGFNNVNWPGRFEILHFTPPLVIDAAHNRDSAKKLKTTLDDYFPDQPVTVVFGASRGKSIRGMLSELAPRITTLVATQSKHPRAASIHKIVTQAKKLGISVFPYPNMETALPYALKTCPETGLVLVTGSVFIAGAARDVWASIIAPKTDIIPPMLDKPDELYISRS